MQLIVSDCSVMMAVLVQALLNCISRSVIVTRKSDLCKSVPGLLFFRYLKLRF